VHLLVNVKLLFHDARCNDKDSLLIAVMDPEFRVLCPKPYLNFPTLDAGGHFFGDTFWLILINETFEIS
jgi:hypothetical protein